MSNDEDIHKEIATQIVDNAVVLYMKGSKHFPQCGFSARIASLLNYLEIDFLDVNVLENFDLRESIKKFSNWPTVPQLYVAGEFIGGCDIILEILASGEFSELLQSSKITHNHEALLRAMES
jgi:monothiol glutaredoxin